MSAGRAVTVRTLDAGVVLIPEPSWCLGEHVDDEHLSDLAHSGAEVALTVHTARGPVRILPACLEQQPYAERAPRGLFVAVELAGEWHRFTPAGLHQLAGDLVAHAATLRYLARELTALGGGDVR